VGSYNAEGIAFDGSSLYVTLMIDQVIVKITDATGTDATGAILVEQSESTNPARNWSSLLSPKEIIWNNSNLYIGLQNGSIAKMDDTASSDPDHFIIKSNSSYTVSHLTLNGDYLYWIYDSSYQNYNDIIYRQPIVSGAAVAIVEAESYGFQNYSHIHQLLVVDSSNIFMRMDAGTGTPYKIWKYGGTGDSIIVDEGNDSFTMIGEIPYWNTGDQITRLEVSGDVRVVSSNAERGLKVIGDYFYSFGEGRILRKATSGLE